ncbi:MULTISPECIES: hypothetical protein [Erwinia]|uniref:FidL-like membrane protein n=1 Tax=Erwinia rhapontici TaxID=55212 RepID=A0ABM7MZU1_ERWRD|nr:MULTISPECIES: hypothetical protein [Erwinia]MBP2155382.1 hypothetical protein [Erwinia rhapontici]MCS3605727.1 hypothetical protein [Erwinia rhapontici]NNS06193.1 hypothetical protein [Erwinia sp. JH02]TDT00018.1 hypothetical protein EDF84_103321 [Erwinia rhapontici]BCQ34580.1 hypothetical protein ERHA53_19230 [Erwinia rhapontici]
MKILLMLAGALMLCAAGWFFAPYLIFLASGDCASKSVLIYDEPDRYIVSQGNWFTYRGGKEHTYSARISIAGPGNAFEDFASVRTIETENHFKYDSVNVRTVKSFRIAGPLTSDPRIGRYIDPLAEEGFTGRIYFFRYKNSGLLTGFKGRPLGLCQ